MKRSAGSLIYSPSDLTRFLENPFITWMDRYHLEFPDKVMPDEISEQDEMLYKAGLEHETTILEGFYKHNCDVFEVPPGEKAVHSTLAATEKGREVIYQAALEHDGFVGYADFLMRIETPSLLGRHSYEVWDTKLARSAKPYFIIQLCCYAEMLGAIQGHHPANVTLILGDGSRTSFRTDDYFFYYLFLKRSFLQQQTDFDTQNRPEPLGRGHNGHWETLARDLMEREDHLRLVAGISTVQIQRLRAAGIATATALGESFASRVSKMLDSTFEKLRQQASLQLRSRNLERPLFELLKHNLEDARNGLALLPPASEMDVVLDLEGFPLAEGGLEYLFGVVYKHASVLRFKDWWAHDNAQEKCAFEGLIDWICERRRQDPKMHVYHYAPYEKTALRRLMGKYGTREIEMDDLLRHEVFIDLYKVLRQGLRVGTGNYSLKSIESIYRGKRETEIASGGDSIVAYQRWLDTGDGATWESSVILRQIRDYNSDDCVSTWELMEWLRTVQARYQIPYVPPPPPKKGGEKPEDAVTSALARTLLLSIPSDRSEDPEPWRVRELLAWLLEFHKREARPVRWEMFHRHEMTEEELYDDDNCLAGLIRTERPPEPFKKSILFEYRFDRDQETRIEAGSACFFAHDLDVHCTVETFDGDEGRVQLKIGPGGLSKLQAGKPPERLSLIPDDYVGAETIAKSIERLVTEYAECSKLPPAIEDFLYRHRPRFIDDRQGPVLDPFTDGLTAAVDCVSQLDHTTLCIQGPPGSGKTFTAGRMILHLLKAGKRIGVTANSHKAIANLMLSVLKFAAEEQYAFNAVKIRDNDAALGAFNNVEFVGGIGDVRPEHQLIGGTAWPFSDVNAVGILDFLFVDEAGQVSVANLVGMAPSTKNIVLIGDQMQLSQPTKAAHPGESGLSTLNYLLQNSRTIPPDMGIFLETTWRLHPEICRFISETIYEGRLRAEPHTAERALVRIHESNYIWKTSGLLFVPVEHEGNTQSSEEEVEVIRELVSELQISRYTAHLNMAVPITSNDILIVAPYNLQVRMLRNALGTSARVGTIDKFQGQEAPVVIVSMCASAAESSSRGIDFLLDRNRLNVALSRAQCLAIVVGNPSLVQAQCTSVQQMRLANLFCRIIEEGSAANEAETGRLVQSVSESSLS